MPPVSIEELKMEKYSQDEDAEAVVLYDYGESFFVPTSQGFELVFKRISRIKILSESGMDWAEVEIPIYIDKGNKEKISNIKGRTYNMVDGMITQTDLDPNQAFDEKLNHLYELKKFAMPNVKEGSIIEYSYEISSKFFFNFYDWEFQWSIPVIHSEYQAKLTPFFTYKWLLQGASKFDSEKSAKSKGLENSIAGVGYKEITHNYVMKNIPAFRNVKFITTKEDYILKMDWQLIKYTNLNGIEHKYMSNWKDIVKEYTKHDSFGKFVSKVEKKADEFISTNDANQMNDQEKVDYVLDYVKDNLEWNGIYARYATQKLNETKKKKTAAISDINLIATGLLNAMEIEAYPMLISTRNHGRIYYKYPFTHYFNYVLIYAKINDEEVVLDATNPYLSNRMIPEKCVNGKGLVIRKEKGDVTWIPINTNYNSDVALELDMEFIDDEVISKTKYTFSNYAAADMREQLNDEDFNPIQDIMNTEGVVSESLEKINADKKEEDLILDFDYTGEINLSADKIYFSPFFKEVIDENPLKETERRFPIDFVHPRKRSYKASLTIPDGYEVEYVKSDYKDLSNDYFDISYQTNITADKVIIEFSYYFKNAVYPKTAYNRLKYYYNEIVKLGQEKVVFKKI